MTKFPDTLAIIRQGVPFEVDGDGRVKLGQKIFRTKLMPQINDQNNSIFKILDKKKLIKRIDVVLEMGYANKRKEMIKNTFSFWLYIENLAAIYSECVWPSRRKRKRERESVCVCVWLCVCVCVCVCECVCVCVCVWSPK